MVVPPPDVGSGRDGDVRLVLWVSFRGRNPTQSDSQCVSHPSTPVLRSPVHVPRTYSEVRKDGYGLCFLRVPSSSELRHSVSGRPCEHPSIVSLSSLFVSREALDGRSALALGEVP